MHQFHFMQFPKLHNKIRQSIQSSILRGFVTTLIGSGGSRVILALSSIIVARTLSEVDFGLYSFVRSTLEMILCICALNFSSLCTKFTTDARQSDKGLHQLGLLFLCSCLICLIVGLLIIFLPENILIHVFVSQNIIKLFQNFGLFLPLFFVAPLIEGVLRGLLKFKLIGVLQTLSAVLFLIAIIIGLHVYEFKGALYAIIFYYFIRSILFIVPILLRPDVKTVFFRLKGFFKEARSIKNIVLPMFLLSFVEAPAFWLAQLILTDNGGFKLVASMTVVMQIRNLILIIPSYFFGTFMAFASKMNSEKKYSDYFNKFDILLRYILGASLILMIILFPLAKPLLGIFGREYYSATIAYYLGVAFIPMYMIMSLFRQHLVIYNRERTMLYLSILWNIIWLGLLISSINFTSINPLFSFFLCQDISLVMYCVALLYFYLKDKNHTSYEINN